MIVDCAYYRDGARQHEGRMSTAEAAAICRSEPGFVWLGMVNPSPEELESVQDTFGLHELAVEDAQSFHLRPKVETYEGGITFVVLRTARYVDESEEVEFGEVAMFVGPGFIISVRQGETDLHGARLRLEARPQLLEEGPASVLWAIVDKIVDDYAPVVEGLERDIEEVEHTVFSGAAAPDTADLPAAARGHRLLPCRAPAARRRCGDHRWRRARGLTGPAPVLPRRRRSPEAGQRGDLAQRDLLTTILQANLAVVSAEQNVVVRKISAWAAIITVPTFVASFYGMNFDGMRELQWHFMYPLVVGLMLALAVGLYVMFRRARWL